LVASGNLERPAALWEETNFDRFHIGARDPEGHVVFALARDSAGVTADASGLIKNLDEISDRFIGFGMFLLSCDLVQGRPP
jgi:hypothetical protein